jgi:hypothetical protein
VARSTRVPIAEAVEPDEVAFPVTGHRLVVGLGGPFANQDLRGDELLPAPTGPCSRDTERSAPSQATTSHRPAAKWPSVSSRAPPLLPGASNKTSSEHLGWCPTMLAQAPSRVVTVDEHL